METPPARLVRRFTLLRTYAAEMTVTSRPIVEALNVIGHVGDRQFSILVDLLLDPFFLQAAEERLGNGIVPAVPFTTHTWLEGMGDTTTIQTALPEAAEQLEAVGAVTDDAVAIQFWSIVLWKAVMRHTP